MTVLARSAGRKPALALLPPAAYPVLSALLFLLLWQVGAVTLGRDLLPSPVDAALAMVTSYHDGYLWSDLGITALRVIGAFALAFLIAVLAGTLFGLSDVAARLLGGWVTVAASIPSLVCVVVTYLIFGINDYSAMIGAALVVAPSMIDVIWHGVRSINPELTEMARAFRFPRSVQLRQVLAPQAAPFLFAAARSGLSSVWRLMIFVELIGRSSGVGYRIQYFYSLADMPRVLGSALPFVILMLLFELFVVRGLERRAFKWQRREMQ